MVKQIQQTLKDVKKIYLFAVTLFLLITVLSSLVSGHHQERLLYRYAKQVVEDEGISFDEKSFEETLKHAEKKPLDKKDYQIIGWEDVKEFFLKNSLIALRTMAFGIIPFLFLPLVGLGFNALALGMVYIMLRSVSDATFSVYLAMILPHGIIEYAAVLLAFSLGLLLCLEGSKRILGKEVLHFSERSKGVLLVYVFIVLPLLAVSAVIEAYITPVIIQSVI